MGHTGESFRPPAWLTGASVVLAGVGGVAVVAGFAADPSRTWADLFLAGIFLAWLGVGALALLAVDAVTGAGWSLPLRRLQEACVAALPAAAVVVLAVLFVQPDLFPSPAVGHPSRLRSWWLERPFFLARAVGYFGIWLLFAWALIRAVRAHEQSGDGPWDARSAGLAAAFLVTFGVTCWLGSYDWLMALQPGWTSTIFGVYNFAGAFLSALAAVTLLAVMLRHHAPLRTFLTADRLHTLGTLVFGFSSFWAYTWYCQYLLTWYTNHPDETSYLRLRWAGDWPAFVLASVVLSWAVPFIVLMPRWTKGNGAVLALVSVAILAGRWLDLFVIIGPTQGAALAAPGLPEAGIGLGAVGVLGLAAMWSLRRLPLVAPNAAQLELAETARPLIVAE
jgi:hypothetical protein